MVVRESNGIWKVARLDLDHNHLLTPEDHDLLFSGQKYMTEMERAMIRTLSHNNIPTRKMIAILSHLRGGVTALLYKKKDVSNYRTKINREVTGTDMSQVLSYFMERKNQDPTFFYKIDVDEDKRLKNLFWAYGSAIKYYAEYGDFTVGTFKWVFEAFVEAMNGKHPKTIITDQDNAIKAAIKIVFPDAVHRNCLFHIKNKCYSKNGKVFANNEGLMEEFEDTVNNSLTTTEFEYLWTKMIADYKLENNNYFTRMWETRERFIPVYYKNEFFPFLHTTTRSETTNARFKDNIGPTYSMISFMKEYQRIVDTIDRTEAEEDTKSRQKQCKELLFDYQIEQQAQKMYNRNILKKFQVQLKETTTLAYTEMVPNKEFMVWPRTNQVRKVYRMRQYMVSANMTEGSEEFTCICGKFSKDGILCSHILKVMVEKDISKIPEQYIIERWRKKDMKIQVPSKQTAEAASASLLRFNMLSRESAALNSKAAATEESMLYLLSKFQELNVEVDGILSRQGTDQNPNKRKKASSTASGVQE
ncbi:protein FAR1-RELATED SEQUENCE 5-like [Panicum virgatum]|uniref:protein FAR1-RELATED SEQUENCE 5-like n=1 Tax=Panicum virgatum TaxID=38727 RepID=UPI0019D519C0|nr:protein FAR1-RELATED SEQUENCE 5-like [Panicum virgatum]